MDKNLINKLKVNWIESGQAQHHLIEKLVREENGKREKIESHILWLFEKIDEMMADELYLNQEAEYMIEFSDEF